LLGADVIGATTLLRFYTHHCVALPLLFAALLSVHLYLIRRDGGLRLTAAAEGRCPDAAMVGRGAILRWELWIAALVTLVGLLVALALPIPLGPEADAQITPNPMKAPWYLVGLQELLHFHPAFLVTYLVPGAFFAGLLALPLLPARAREVRLADLTRPASAGLHAAMLALAVASLPPVAWHPDLTVVLACALGSGALALARGPLRGSLGQSNLPTALLGWTLLTYLALAAVGAFLRGPGWSLLWIP
jgi:quinol-cytochrome oxidoreductase complex cytochrome b subunit